MTRPFLLLFSALALVAASCSSSSSQSSPTSTSVFSPTRAPSSTASPPRPPLQVLLIGDELMAQAGPVVKDRLERTGSAEVRIDTEALKGLASSIDWLPRLEHDVEDFHATVVVVSFGGADSPPYRLGPDGTPFQPATSRWYNHWALTQAVIVVWLEEHGIKTYWVPTPPARDADADNRVHFANLLSEALHRDYADSVAHIDTRRDLVGPDGGFAEEVTSSDGQVLHLRSADGYGLGPDGAQRMGNTIADRITAQWCLADTTGSCTPAFTSVNSLPSGAPPGPRVLLVGDSMMWQLVPAIAGKLEAGGRIQVHADTRSTTSLVGPYDWPSRLTALVDTYRPDVVVGLFSGDLQPGFTDPQGEPVAMNTQRYYDLTAAAMQDATTRLHAHGARVLWVAGPTTGLPDVVQRFDTFRALYEGIAERSGGTVDVIDGFAPLAGPDGEFVTQLPDATGRPVLVRLPDALHLTSAGVARLADAVVTAVRSDPCVAGTGPCLPAH